ncbi:hypothetical protein HZ326_4690 [Fusarium oxysporum f. sp. albedinis]|nr:hypothetical protein HZ326_4690 [Fusarium oxysporum f. sp. albedinis]
MKVYFSRQILMPPRYRTQAQQKDLGWKISQMGHLLTGRRNKSHHKAMWYRLVLPFRSKVASCYLSSIAVSTQNPISMPFKHLFLSQNAQTIEQPPTYMNVPPSRRLHLFDLPSHTSSFVLVVVAAILENRPFIDTRSVL